VTHVININDTLTGEKENRNRKGNDILSENDKLINTCTHQQIKGILSILDQNFDHGDFVYSCMKLKEWRV